MGLLRITELSKVLNIHPNTLRNWEKQGKISPERTVGGHRRYDLKKIESILKLKYKTLIFINAQDDAFQKKYTQCVMEDCCKRQGYAGYSVVEIGENNEQFVEIISMIETGNVKNILIEAGTVFTSKQKVIFESVCNKLGVTVKVIDVNALTADESNESVEETEPTSK